MTTALNSAVAAVHNTHLLELQNGEQKLTGELLQTDAACLTNKKAQHRKVEAELFGFQVHFIVSN